MSFGPHTVADKDAKAVVRERLAIVEADEVTSIMANPVAPLQFNPAPPSRDSVTPASTVNAPRSALAPMLGTPIGTDRAPFRRPRLRLRLAPSCRCRLFRLGRFPRACTPMEATPSCLPCPTTRLKTSPLDPSRLNRCPARRSRSRGKPSQIRRGYRNDEGEFHSVEVIDRIFAERVSARRIGWIPVPAAGQAALAQASLQSAARYRDLREGRAGYAHSWKVTASSKKVID